MTGHRFCDTLKQYGLLPFLFLFLSIRKDDKVVVFVLQRKTLEKAAARLQKFRET
jgi:hypothetical protein